MSYTERTQVLLSPEQRAKVARIAERTHRSIGAVIRDAVDAYGSRSSPDRRRRALDELFSLEAPVDDWDLMEREIERGYAGDVDESA